MARPLTFRMQDGPSSLTFCSQASELVQPFLDWLTSILEHQAWKAMKRPVTYFGKWGNVPVDGDVRPFSTIDPYNGATDRGNRKHHFVSVVYMRGFADASGRVQVYRQEDPENPQPMQPRATAYEKDYYSQKLPGGGQETHRFEDLWNGIETVWPETVRALEARRLSPAISFNVQGMQVIMCARVPATRDRHALILETKLRQECKVLEEAGKLPPDLEQYRGQFDTIPVGINPQETLLAMVGEFNKHGDLCFQLGFEVLHNKTDLPFLTSDNPVCSYDPSQPPSLRTPYDHSGEIELIFPITARMLLRGSSRIRPANIISGHRDVESREDIHEYNRTIAQFAYRLTIGHDRSSDDLVRRYSSLVPTISMEVLRSERKVQIVWSHIFGPRPIFSQFIDTPEKAARLEARMAGSST